MKDDYYYQHLQPNTLKDRDIFLRATHDIEGSFTGRVDDDNERTAEVFKEKLESIGFRFPENYKQIRPSVLADEWLPKTNEFLKVLRSMLSRQ